MAKRGPKRQLLDGDENALTKCLINCTKIGYGKSKSVAVMLAGEIVWKWKTPFKFGLPSEKLWKGFMKCHPKIMVRVIKNFGRACTSVFAEDITSFCDI